MLYSSANLTKDIRGSIYCIQTCIMLARLTVKCGVPFFHHNTKYIHVHIQLVTAVKLVTIHCQLKERSCITSEACESNAMQAPTTTPVQRENPKYCPLRQTEFSVIRILTTILCKLHNAL